MQKQRCSTMDNLEALLNSIANGQWVQAGEQKKQFGISFRTLYDTYVDKGYDCRDIAILADIMEGN